MSSLHTAGGAADHPGRCSRSRSGGPQPGFPQTPAPPGPPAGWGQPSWRSTTRLSVYCGVACWRLAIQHYDGAPGGGRHRLHTPRPEEGQSSAPATPAPSHPKPLHAGNSQAPACGAPASRQRERDLRPGLQRLLSSRGKQPPPEEKDVPFGTSEKRASAAPTHPSRLPLSRRTYF